MTNVTDSPQNVSPEHMLQRMARLFRERDKAAVEEFNADIEYYAPSLEARLFFRESRLIDAANVLSSALDIIAITLEQDAARYRWLKSRQGLALQSVPQPNVWTRPDGTKFSCTHSLAEGGTQHAPGDSLDAIIDAAMAGKETV